MKLTAENKIALVALIATLEQQIPTLQAQATANPQDATAVETFNNKKAELDANKLRLQAHDMATRNEELEIALLAQRTKDAEELIKATVARGAILPQDTATQDAWKKRLIEDPAANAPLVHAMRSSPALAPQRITFGSGVTITREDSVMVLRAYQAERDPLKRGRIYAADMSKRIRDGEEIPFHASNTLGTVAGEVVTQFTLELLTLDLPMLQSVATDFSSEAVVYNTEVNSRIVGIPGTTSYNTSTGYATENTTFTDVPVTIDGHKSCQVAFNANELASTSRRLFDELAPAMAYAIGKDFIDSLYGKILAADFTNITTCALVDFELPTVRAMAGALSDRGVPLNTRTILLNGDYHDKLFSDSTIEQLAAFQRADLVSGTKLLKVADFNPFRASNLPTTGNLTGFGYSKSALVLATRLPNDYSKALPGATGGGTVQTITEPKTGLSMMLVEYVDHQLGVAARRLAYMFGSAKGQVNAGQFLRSSV